MSPHAFLFQSVEHYTLSQLQRQKWAPLLRLRHLPSAICYSLQVVDDALHVTKSLTAEKHEKGFEQDV